MLEGRKKRLDSAAKQSRSSSATPPSSENGSIQPQNEDDTSMMRKPIRIRRQRIPVLQSGYCAICNLPYNSIEDHVQSKKHQKLVGDDARYLALNGYIHADVGIESLLDAIAFDDFSPQQKRPDTMSRISRSRAPSVMSDIYKRPATPPFRAQTPALRSATPALRSYTPALDGGFQPRLRSRKSVNYTDEDSFQEKPLQNEMPSPVRFEYKEYRELRSSTRALARITSCTEEVWDSGRPKRACIGRSTRLSSDENKTYYKVEVMPDKATSDRNKIKEKESKIDDDKGLIVKFKKLRRSGKNSLLEKQLIELNNEATNFLFPKRDDSSDDETVDEDSAENMETEEEKESVVSSTYEVTSSSELGDMKPPDKFKVEDEASMDSIMSDGKRAPKKRTSHTEAFIRDNEKYYKFEKPSSRLRYHGSYLSPAPPKSNGNLVTKKEPKIEPKVENPETKAKPPAVNLDKYTFSFEVVPDREAWYQSFQRQDRFEQVYNFTPNYHWDEFVLPYQIPHLRALDPRHCYQAYKSLKDHILKLHKEPSAQETSVSNLDEADGDQENSDENEGEIPSDDDSKRSETSSLSASTADELKEITSTNLSPTSRCRNSRKSPRQHASTLAILSSLKKRPRLEQLQPIPEESVPEETISEEPISKEPISEEIISKEPISEEPISKEAISEEPTIPVPEKPSIPVPEEPTKEPCPRRAASMGKFKPISQQKIRKKKVKVDYFEMAAKIDEHLTSMPDLDLDEFVPTTDPDDVLMSAGMNLAGVTHLYEEPKEKVTATSCRRFFNGAPGRKPGKRRKNMTGWPNKVKRKRVIKSETNSIHGSNPESENDSELPQNIEMDENKCTEKENKCTENEEKCMENENKLTENDNRVISEIRDSTLEAYVIVEKLEHCASEIKPRIRHKIVRRTLRKKAASVVKVARVRRKHTGGWYRER